MKNILIFISLIAAASAWSCDSGEDTAAEQNFTAASGIYYGPAVSMPADSLVLTFIAGDFTNGKPSGEAKRLTVTCYVPSMFDDSIYLEDGEYTAASPDAKLPVFIPGTADINPDNGLITAWQGTCLEAWTSTTNVGIMLFTEGSISVKYSNSTEQYTITANLSDANGNTFNTTYIGELNLSLPNIDYDENPTDLTAMYYGDGNSAHTQRWVLDMFSDIAATGGYRGIFLDIHANRIFAEGTNTLQEGEYHIGSGDATGTYLPGGYDNGTHTGSYYYVMDKGENVIDGIYITGGTFTIARSSEEGGYTLTANLRGRNINTDAEETKTMQYTGTPLYLDMTGSRAGKTKGSYKF